MKVGGVDVDGTDIGVDVASTNALVGDCRASSKLGPVAVTRAGEEGRDCLLMIEPGFEAMCVSEDARDNPGVTGVLTSKIPPPDVTSGFSRVGLRQKDQRLVEASVAGAASDAGASGSPSFDRLSQGDSVFRD